MKIMSGGRARLYGSRRFGAPRCLTGQGRQGKGKGKGRKAERPRPDGCHREREAGRAGEHRRCKLRICRAKRFLRRLTRRRRRAGKR